MKGRNNKFTSIDRVTVTPTATGCDVTYDAILTANGIYFFMNFALGRVFQKVGDAAVAGLRKKLA